MIYVLKRFMSMNIAAFVAFLIVIIQIRSPVFLPDDYHIFQRTLFFVGVALYAIYFDCKQQDRRALALAALLAVFCSLFIFAKQNIGVLLSFGVLIALIRDAVTRNADWKVPALFAVTFTASIPLFAFLLGITVDQLFGISFGNDSKGSLFTIATNLFSKPHNVSLLQKGVIVVSILIGAGLLFRNAFWRDVVAKYLTTGIKDRLLPALMIVALPVGLVIFIRYSQTYISLFAVMVILSGIVGSFFTTHKIFSLSYPAFGLMYANSMTSDLVDETLILVAAPALGFILEKVVTQPSNRQLLVVLMTGAVIVLSLNTLNRKMVSPYGWWGYAPAPVTSATKEPPYEMLKNLRVGVETYDLLTTIKDAVNTHSSERDDVYFYPHMPFFYIMHDKLPPTRNPVQWFDVIPDREMQKEIAAFEADPPKLMVVFDSPYFVHLGHQAMKKQSYQTQFIDILNEKVAAGELESLDYRIFAPSMHSTLDKLEASIVVAQPENFGRPVKEILDQIIGLSDANDLTLVSIVSDGITVASQDNAPSSNDLSHIVQEGDVITIRATKALASRSIKMMGYVPKHRENWYNLRILRRSEG